MLLDTHTLLWFLDDNPKLTPEIRDTIETADTVVVSIITLWEIAIKLSIQKLELQLEFQELPSLLEQLNITVLPLIFADLQCYASLPLHHRDPFDRMLIAQAINHSLAIVSSDQAFDHYEIQRVWSEKL
ncbi:type II toxin-antitoxin system VapC family toxin [Limnoraphis robusta]|uniref:Type II toxin-antitoxin system VapC family toxin n=1 Tax=Limnoraphis robusta CCNP1315 TaxID=3110306 RepID=A0ABU5U5D3_9CYAN|nr:type II toxin-antitoxin system VapC family toxin [Limnoraphis robusta]MEA5522401.1 type II toxin-antitoxin system VapC family toxin [Limnoraphis robusta CCNP1315]MEA5546160.1 type II toxin-antitoxin system VapC family toxin [Limnoraphis robusta CCNP1324]